MSVSSILDSTSFGGLDDAGQKAVRNLFDETYHSGQQLTLDHLQLFRQRKSLAITLNYYGDRLNKINPASFKFLSNQQRTVLREELLFAFYIFSAQYQLDEAEHRRQGLSERSEQIKTCAVLLNTLKIVPEEGREETPEQQLSRAIDDSDKHAKYLGLTLIAPLLAEKMVDLAAGTTIDAEQWKNPGKTAVIKEWMGELNGRRLYWVWANSLLGSVFALLPNDFANNSQAQLAVGTLSPITGYMSWILYYTRFGINLSLLLKHTIAGPWMSVKEREIPMWERFKTQWDQRKFSLLNDSIWATANMASFLWLTGSGMLGYFGNVATTVLLLMDVSLTIWRFYEEDTQHNANLARYEAEMAALLEKIDLKDVEGRHVIGLQLDGVLKAKKQCEVDWQYKKYNLVNDLVYAASLMIAFVLMCSFLFPPVAIVPATALILGLAGGAMCFLLNMAYAAVASGLEIMASREKNQSVADECNVLLLKFGQADKEFVKKQLYLDMKRLAADSVYQERLVHFQKLKLVHAVLIDALVPPLVFVSFMFMPLGVGLAVLAAGLALAVIAHYILKEFAPVAAKLPELDEDEYAIFAQKPTISALYIDKKPKKQESLGFWKETPPSDGALPSAFNFDEDVPPASTV